MLARGAPRVAAEAWWREDEARGPPALGRDAPGVRVGRAGGCLCGRWIVKVGTAAASPPGHTSVSLRAGSLSPLPRVTTTGFSAVPPLPGQGLFWKHTRPVSCTSSQTPLLEVALLASLPGGPWAIVPARVPAASCSPVLDVVSPSQARPVWVGTQKSALLMALPVQELQDGAGARSADSAVGRGPGTTLVA